MRCQKSLLPATVALALALTGCASLEPFAAPEVTLVDVRFEDLTVFETSGTFKVRLSNENPEPMVVDGAVYKLYLGGQRVGKALSDARVELPRLGSTVYEVDLYINNVALVARLLTLGQERGLDYTIKGKLYVERSYGLRRVRFSRDGRIDLGAGRAGPPAEEAVSQPASGPDSG
jgi:LEA14-like dessication related protein